MFTESIRSYGQRAWDVCVMQKKVLNPDSSFFTIFQKNFSCRETLDAFHNNLSNQVFHLLSNTKSIATLALGLLVVATVYNCFKDFPKQADRIDTQNESFSPILLENPEQYVCISCRDTIEDKLKENNPIQVYGHMAGENSLHMLCESCLTDSLRSLSEQTIDGETIDNETIESIEKLLCKCSECERPYSVENPRKCFTIENSPPEENPKVIKVENALLTENALKKIKFENQGELMGLLGTCISLSLLIALFPKEAYHLLRKVRGVSIIEPDNNLLRLFFIKFSTTITLSIISKFMRDKTCKSIFRFISAASIGGLEVKTAIIVNLLMLFNIFVGRSIASHVAKYKFQTQ